MFYVYYYEDIYVYYNIQNRVMGWWKKGKTFHFENFLNWSNSPWKYFSDVRLYTDGGKWESIENCVGRREVTYTHIIIHIQYVFPYNSVIAISLLRTASVCVCVCVCACALLYTVKMIMTKQPLLIKGRPQYVYKYIHIADNAQT